MARRRRPPPPSGPEVGQAGTLPPWLDPPGLTQYPPQPRYHLQVHYRGHNFHFVAMYGNFGVARTLPDGAVGIYFLTWAEVWDYQNGGGRYPGAPGGGTGGVAFTYSCILRRVDIVDDKPPQPRARKRWEDLSPQYRKNISGTMKQRYGLKTEAQQKHYYETAYDLSGVRRHASRTVVVEGIGRISFPRGGDENLPPWLITWKKS